MKASDIRLLRRRKIRELRLLRFFSGLYYSLPVQLAVRQLRFNKVLLMFWVFWALVATQTVMVEFGAPYLLLEPDYLDRFDFWAVFWVGVCLGIFTLAYQLSCYIIEGYNFYFLLTDSHPFLRFCLNNSLIPTGFWILYLYCFLSFHDFEIMAWEYGGGAVLGGAVVSIVAFLYFRWTNRDLFQLLGQTIVSELRRPRTVIREAKRAMDTGRRVDYYLAHLWRVKRPPRVMRADVRTIVRVLNQNHANALFAEILIFIFLAVVGIFEANPYMQIPAAGSFFLLGAFVTMIIGAVSFWLRRIGPLTFILALAALWGANKYSFYMSQNQAYGLDYSGPPTPYSVGHLSTLYDSETLQQDYAAEVRRLENWKFNYEKKYGAKPKMVLLCVTGGGTRSAVWTVQCLQDLDRRMGGKFIDQIGVISGASGGMMGAAFFRDLMYRRCCLGDTGMDLYDPAHVEAISKDMLNAPIFSLSTNFITPRPKFTDAGMEYQQDRGYVFDRRFEAITGLGGRRLGHYAQAERDGTIPLLLLCSAIVNDARTLIVSPQNLSFLAKPAFFNTAYENEISAVEFRRLFAARRPDSLRFSTALRLNATFPTILPFVELPTEPMIELMDAGAVDNYGVNMAVKYLYAMQNWLKQNTSGVVLVQIRDHVRVSPIYPRSKDLVDKTLGIFGGTYNTLIESKDFFNDQLLEYARALYPARFDVVELEYIPGRRFREATLSFRLTQREKEDVADAIHRPENLRAIRMLEQLLK
jgi:hypothetical protein